MEGDPEPRPRMVKRGCPPRSMLEADKEGLGQAYNTRRAKPDCILLMARRVVGVASVVQRAPLQLRVTCRDVGRPLDRITSPVKGCSIRGRINFFIG
jgi:hypothetical protein